MQDMHTADFDSNAGFFVWDFTSNCIYGDVAFWRLYEFQNRESNGSSLRDVIERIHPEDRPELISAIKRTIATASSYDAGYRLTRKNGGTIYVHSTGQVFTGIGSQGCCVGVVFPIAPAVPSPDEAITELLASAHATAKVAGRHETMKLIELILQEQSPQVH